MSPLAYYLGTITGAPSGDLYVSDLLETGGPQTSTVKHLDPSGVVLGVVGSDANSSGVETPAVLTTDPLNDVLFSYYSSTTGGNDQTTTATKATPTGTVLKQVSATWGITTGTGLRVSTMGGDSAGDLLIDADVEPAPGEVDPVGIDFGMGPELGHLVLRYDAAETYLGSIPSPGTWASDAEGNLYVVQTFQGMTDIGCGPVMSGASSSLLLARLDFGGNCVWSEALQAGMPSAFVVGVDGSIDLAFAYSGKIDLGAGPMTSAPGAESLAVGKLDLQGNLLWSTSFGGAGASFSQVAIDASPSGIVLLSSVWKGAVDLGGGPLDTAAGDTFVAAFDATGAYRWSKVLEAALWAPTGHGITMTHQACSMVIATQSPAADLGSGPIVPAYWDIGVAALGL
jgi:hypothetical protein